ncbi:MAG: hypothetical protein MJE68_09545 [Proteobacteria bacterium]|nr:hypothetical protein [Pseudomonadota bacterium]
MFGFWKKPTFIHVMYHMKTITIALAVNKVFCHLTSPISPRKLHKKRLLWRGSNTSDTTQML